MLVILMFITNKEAMPGKITEDSATKEGKTAIDDTEINLWNEKVE